MSGAHTQADHYKHVGQQEDILPTGVAAVALSACGISVGVVTSSVILVGVSVGVGTAGLYSMYKGLL